MSDDTQTTDTQRVKRKTPARKRTVKRKSRAGRSRTLAERDADRRRPGRPEKVIDGDLVERLASEGSTDEEIAHVVDCSRDTLTRRFGDRLRAGRLSLTASLRRRQVQAALNPGDKASPQMLRWLGIQLLGQREKSEVTGADGGPLQRQVSITLELPEQVKRMVQLMQAAGASEEQIQALLPPEMRALPPATPQPVVVDADFEDVPRQRIDN